MTDSTPAVVPPLEQLVLPAEACEGDVCVIPAHHGQHIVNRRLDEDLV